MSFLECFRSSNSKTIPRGMKEGTFPALKKARSKPGGQASRASAASSPVPPAECTGAGVDGGAAKVDHVRLAHAIVAWFAGSGRQLPWRSPGPAGSDHPRDPYATLVSELMLQQTQVSRVVEKFKAFMAEFPTARALAAADEARVLALWSGLGYYRRARLLHAAAKVITAEHGGALPRDLEALHRLPGVGRYTAGAIASIAMGQPVPLVDGNVARVLFRIHGKDAVHADPNDMEWAWACASSLVQSADRSRVQIGNLNEGLMELGATVCTPAAPACVFCPVQALCTAFATGRQEEIPLPKKPVQRSAMWCEAVLVFDDAQRVLVEQRPDRGMWAGLWQAPTFDHASAGPWSAGTVAAALEIDDASRVHQLDRFRHQTTHRDVTFTVWVVSPTPGEMQRLGTGRRWVGAHDLDGLGLSNPQRRILTRKPGAAGPAFSPAQSLGNRANGRTASSSERPRNSRTLRS